MRTLRRLLHYWVVSADDALFYHRGPVHWPNLPELAVRRRSRGNRVGKVLRYHLQALFSFVLRNQQTMSTVLGEMRTAELCWKPTRLAFRYMTFVVELSQPWHSFSTHKRKKELYFKPFDPNFGFWWWHKNDDIVWICQFIARGVIPLWQ